MVLLVSMVIDHTENCHRLLLPLFLFGQLVFQRRDVGWG